MKNLKTENGAIIVEASIYFPLVLCTVMALLYLALFNMQEHMLMYQVKKIAAVASREEAYMGYEEFGMGSGNEIDFAWGEGSLPSADQINAYYKAYHKKLSDIYREIGRGLANSPRTNYDSRFSNAARDATLIVMGTINEPEVEVDTGFLGTEITVTITHSLPVPGVLKYLGYDGGRVIRAASYGYSLNPGQFVRNVDLACDLVSYIMDKFGQLESYKQFLEKTNEVLSKIL